MNELNLVILGLPSSGKTALLGALQQAGRGTGTQVDGALIDVTGDLTRLRQEAVANKLKPTPQGGTTYRLERPIPGGVEKVAVHDTSGAEAIGILSGKQPLTVKSRIPKTLADPDGVILAIDASASEAELDRNFEEFAEFLEAWQSHRSHAVKVGGLPVFLVLTKCDKLAQKGDTVGKWIDRIETRKREAGARFQAALADSRDRSFGRIDVHVWGSATQRPGQSKVNEPYQVAELFEQVFDAAHAYRDRTDRSSQTLHGAMVGLGATAVLLSLAMAWYYAIQPTPEEAALERRVQSIVAGEEGGIAERVREPLEDRLKEIQELMADPAYTKLSPATQEQVAKTEAAIESYKRLNEAYQKDVLYPRRLETEKDLRANAAKLAEYDAKIETWPETRLAKRHQEWKSDTQAMLLAAAAEQAWFKTQADEAEALRREFIGEPLANTPKRSRAEWIEAARKMFARGRPHDEKDYIPKAEPPKDGGEPEKTTIPYRAVYKIDTVQDAELRLQVLKDRVRKLHGEAVAK